MDFMSDPTFTQRYVKKLAEKYQICPKTTLSAAATGLGQWL